MTSLPAGDSRPRVPGCLPAKTSWSLSPPCRYSSARSSERHCTRLLCSRSWMRASGTRTGSYTASPSAVARKPSESLAPSIFRVAISHHRILTLEDGHVTCQYKDSATDQTHSVTMPAHECIRRFLPHVLPDRCINVRDDGFLSPANRPLLTQVSIALGARTVKSPTLGQHPDGKESTHAREAPRCPRCGDILIRVETLKRRSRWPPCACMDRRSSPLRWGRRPGSVSASRDLCSLLREKPPHPRLVMIYPANKYRRTYRRHGSSTA